MPPCLCENPWWSYLCLNHVWRTCGRVVLSQLLSVLSMQPLSFCFHHHSGQVEQVHSHILSMVVSSHPPELPGGEQGMRVTIWIPPGTTTPQMPYHLHTRLADRTLQTHQPSQMTWERRAKRITLQAKTWLGGRTHILHGMQCKVQTPDFCCSHHFGQVQQVHSHMLSVVVSSHPLGATMWGTRHASNNLDPTRHTLSICSQDLQTEPYKCTSPNDMREKSQEIDNSSDKDLILREDTHLWMQCKVQTPDL